jgi:hypothetical protein
MILNSAPKNKAVLSNVGEIGEFRIRNSAKAFSILSSGLYANKIRAIVRELSCNAYDSHIAANKKTTPFDIHLPNTFDPYFSIRDYGIGLNHDQVSQIYTTYFESTKSNSNDFIGALGLGSKTPFSYTDNFTVTAIKDGRKGIYSAFINGSGVPSIALMMEEETIEPTGVEVKFAINDQRDFDKFRYEAQSVLTYFETAPIVSGYTNFRVNKVDYTDKDIIPGVHATSNRGSVAVMGHIAYPIDIPTAAAHEIGKVSSMLSCGLELHFAIGELDFQASREGLSYIPDTVAAIKRKLDVLNAHLAIHVAAEAMKFDNLWDRAIYLVDKESNRLWSNAVLTYVVDSKFELLTTIASRKSLVLKKFVVVTSETASKFNVVVRMFSKFRSQNKIHNSKADTIRPDPANPASIDSTWGINVSAGVHFVKNDTKVGATERAKYHWRKTVWSDDVPYTMEVAVLDAADRDKPADYEGFLKSLNNPPRVQLASALLEKPRKVKEQSGKNVTILVLKRKSNYNTYSPGEFTWQDAGNIADFDNSTFYYLPMSGYTIESSYGHVDAKILKNSLVNCGIDAANVPVYGVRKSDIEFIKKQKNWVNIEKYLVGLFSNIDRGLLVNLAVRNVDNFSVLCNDYTHRINGLVIDKNSLYSAFYEKYKDNKSATYNSLCFAELTKTYGSGSTINIADIEKEIREEAAKVCKYYPLLTNIEYRDRLVKKVCDSVSEYINMCNNR